MCCVWKYFGFIKLFVSLSILDLIVVSVDTTSLLEYNLSKLLNPITLQQSLMTMMSDLNWIPRDLKWKILIVYLILYLKTIGISMHQILSDAIKIYLWYSKKWIRKR